MQLDLRSGLHEVMVAIGVVPRLWFQVCKMARWTGPGVGDMIHNYPGRIPVLEMTIQISCPQNSSKKNHGGVVHVDIGGGPTDIAIFTGGVIAHTHQDLGGHRCSDGARSAFSGPENLRFQAVSKWFSHVSWLLTSSKQARGVGSTDVDNSIL